MIIKGKIVSVLRRSLNQTREAWFAEQTLNSTPSHTPPHGLGHLVFAKISENQGPSKNWVKGD